MILKLPDSINIYKKPRSKRGTKQTAKSKIKKPQKLRKHAKPITRMRAKRSKEREEVARIYSPRAETKAISPMVAYKPYATEQLPSLESTAIKKASYDPKTRLLTITFWTYKQQSTGKTYDFFAVPYDLWVAFNEASSKGRFFYYLIRDAFRYRRH